MPEAFPQELFALLGMAEVGQPGEPESLIPKITQEACRHDRHNALPRQLLYEPLSAMMPTRGALRSDAAHKHCEEATRSGGS